MVDIAANSGDGGDIFEFAEDGDFAYIAKVQNASDAGERRSYFGAKESVGVADYANSHLFEVTRNFSASGPRVDTGSGFGLNLPHIKVIRVAGCGHLDTSEAGRAIERRADVFFCIRQNGEWNLERRSGGQL